MRLTIVEHPAAHDAGAVYGARGNQTIIVVDPHLDDAEKYRLIRELLTET